jgi:parvulin-like peptidyl-prolyl isomerase
MRKCVFLLVLALLPAVGCMSRSKPKYTEEELAQIPLAQKEGLPACSGGFVLAVGDETITADEIITEPLLKHFRPIAQRSDFEPFKEQAKPELERILATQVSNILLYREAKKDAGEQVDEALERVAEAEIRKFVAGFDNDYAKAEEALKERRMDWRSFKEYQKKLILSQSYIASQFPEQRPITYDELTDYYHEMKDEFFVRPAMIKFRLIDIEAAKLEVANPNQGRQQLAKELANELLEQIRGGEDFGELAKQYSHGHTALFGGLWKPLQPESLAEPYDILAAEAEGIEPGQIAGPIEEGEHIFIMKLEEKQARSVEPFEKVQKEIEARIALDRRKKVIDELEAKLMQQAKLGEKNEFIYFCLEKIYQISNR